MVQIDSGYFCAGLLLDNNKVMICAPIIKYMMGWSLERVMNYCKYKNWKYTIDEKE